MSNAKDSHPGIDLFFIVVSVCMLCGFLWFEFRHVILEFLRYLRLGEAWLVSPFTDSAISACRTWLRIARYDDKAPTDAIIHATQQCFLRAGYLSSQGNDIDYYGLTGPSIMAIGQILVPYLRWPWLIALMGAANYLIFFSRFTKYRKIHTLETFIRAQAAMWPVISPIVNFNPITHSARVPGAKLPNQLPLFAEALSPEEWVSYYRIPVVNDVPDRELTRRAFVQQLGPRWKGIKDCPLYVQALIAAYALKGVQRREESDALLGKIATCWTEKNGLVLTSEIKNEVKKTLKDAEIGGAALEIADQSAYRTTALLNVLRWARWGGGVLAPAQFLWLRGVDRPLWYALNNLGRRSFHTEGAGALAHHMAEQNAKKPLPIPRVDTAIITLNSYFHGNNRVIPLRDGDKASART